MDNTHLQRYLHDHNINAEILTMSGRVRSVAEASQELGVPPDRFIKTVVFIDSEEKPILAIVQGTDRASSKRIGKALGIPPPTLATSDDAARLTGYKVGGTPPVSIVEAKTLIDPNVTSMEEVVGGGGTDHHLLRINPAHILEATNATVVRIRK
ncbi:MAG: aminoacyl-tRNA deacylase [Candidatus Thorarchaeota archaeon]|jgi:prolyl-tRNA editing enzyme YbaK/EbsC (Cys-tRNA(Pro) deacylase)